MKIWLNEKVSAPNGYVSCKNINEAIEFIIKMETYNNMYRDIKASPNFKEPEPSEIAQINGLMRASIDDVIKETSIESISVPVDSNLHKRISKWLSDTHRNYHIDLHPSSGFSEGERVFISGDSTELWIEDYNCKVCTYGKLEETPSLNAKKVFITLDDIDGEENVCCRVRVSKLKKI